MSNKSKLQHQQQQQAGQGQSQNQIVNQQQQQQQVKDVTIVEPAPPRYQPPPQPSSGILKSQQVSQPTTLGSYGGHGGTAGIGNATAALARHQQLQQQQHHQQQDVRLAIQVKDAVQSKFAQNIELPHTQSVRTDKLAGSFGLPHSKNFLPLGISKPSTDHNITPALGSTIGASATTSNAPVLTINGQNVARPRISDDEFLRLGPVEMLKFVRKTESDLARLAAEQHRQIQSLINELRLLKEANQRLNDDNQELRDLCCFLDDDRQKGRKLAREWQRFGRYTASVMRQEVSAYQNKLRQLDNKQQELIKDNLELKELCLYLDEERGGGHRDDGDGSSSSTNADETTAPQPARVTRHQSSSAFNDQTMQYVRSLEQRVKQLEEDKSILQARAQGWTVGPNEVWDNPRNSNEDFQLGGRPEAVVRALQVLEVREQLEREAGHDGEKALVREMCNVVWRKLEEGPGPVRNSRI